MRKYLRSLLVMSIILALAVNPMMAVASSKQYDAHLTDLARDGSGPPAYSSVWTLANGSYTASYQIETAIWTNYNFVTTSGIIRVNMTASNPGRPPMSSDTYRVMLYENGVLFDTKIGEIDMSKDYGGSCAFTGLSSDAKYYVEVRKTSDGTYMSGIMTIGQ